MTAGSPRSNPRSRCSTNRRRWRDVAWGYAAAAAGHLAAVACGANEAANTAAARS